MASSFLEIGKRYDPASAIIDSLAKHILLGSYGIWRTTKMPSHPELTGQETQNIVRWIFKNTGDSSLNYLAGLDGSFRIPNGQKGVFVLTASYLDLGIKNEPGQNLQGENSIEINVRSVFAFKSVQDTLLKEADK